jgi:hypothetical protein
LISIKIGCWKKVLWLSFSLKKTLFKLKNFSLLAQLAELLTVNQKVLGSSPREGALKLVLFV